MKPLSQKDLASSTLWVNVGVSLRRPSTRFLRPPCQSDLDGNGSLYRRQRQPGLPHQDIHNNPECGVARELQFFIGDAYGRIQESAQEEMAKITLQDVIDGYYSRAGNEKLPD